MSLRSFGCCVACFAAACLGLAGCATTAPADTRARMVGIPMASAHANLGFAMTTGAKPRVICSTPADCPPAAASDAASRFAMQVQQIAQALQGGAEDRYPDLAQRTPALADGRFEVYVVADEEPGSASGANGRIALNSALGIWQPYDEWLAFVIAREMGHVIARHHEENSAASIVTSVIMNIIIPGSSLLKSAISAGGSKMAAISKREVQALEADAIALDLLDAAGFRQPDVALSLRIAPAIGNDNLWSRAFRQSAENFLAGKPAATLLVTSAEATPH